MSAKADKEYKMKSHYKIIITNAKVKNNGFA